MQALIQDASGAWPKWKALCQALRNSGTVKKGRPSEQLSRDKMTTPFPGVRKNMAGHCIKYWEGPRPVWFCLFQNVEMMLSSSCKAWLWSNGNELQILTGKTASVKGIPK